MFRQQLNPSQRFRHIRAGFTLIELLIVVAIIAILASIAVPNFLEAQARAKVSRAQADLRTIITGLESYAVDWSEYPPTPMETLVDREQRLSPITTPVAYLSALPSEIFTKGKRSTYAYWSPSLNDAMKFATFTTMYYYLTEERRKRGRWVLFSRGPDIDYEIAIEEGGEGVMMYYDPTNGTASSGDIMRFGP